MRAGKLITGEELVIQAIRSRKAKLVILSEDASPNTAKKVIDKCYSYHIDCMKYGDRNQLGQATGKDQRVVLAVTDDGFARKMKTILSD